MDKIFGSSKVQRDDTLERQRAEAEARTAREKAELEERQRADEDARRRGLRGVRQLFSGAGGFLGFPAGDKTTLGG